MGRKYIYGRDLDGQVVVGGSLTGRLLPIDPEAEQTGNWESRTATRAGSDGKRHPGQGILKRGKSKKCSSSYNLPKYPTSLPSPLSPCVPTCCGGSRALPYVTPSESRGRVEDQKALEAIGWNRTIKVLKEEKSQLRLSP